jgi:anti-sigma B factor antagonist
VDQRPFFRLEVLDPPEPGCLVVALHGELDVDATDAVDRLADLTDARPSLLTIDLRPLTFVDSTGVRALLVTLGRTRAAGVTLRIVRAGPRVQRVFELLCLDTVLPFVDPDD